MSLYRTPVQDHNKRIAIINRLERLCIQCGGFCEIRPADGVRVCLRCGGTQYVECYESEAAEWRDQIQLAQEIVCANISRFDALRMGLNSLLNMGPDFESFRNETVQS